MKPVSLLALVVIWGCASTAPPDAGAGGTAGTDAGTGGEGGMGPSVSERRVFVTEAVQDGSFGGIPAADGICASEAAAAGLNGEFQAWLSTMTSPVADRFVRSTVPYVLVDGTVVADGWDDLVDGSIQAPINLDANGQPRDGDVWTGTLPSGQPYTGGDCEGFTDALAGISQCGSTQNTEALWTAAQTPACNTPLRLYCVEQ